MTEEKRAKLKAKLKLVKQQIEVLTDEWVDIENELEELHREAASIEARLAKKK